MTNQLPISRRRFLEGAATTLFLSGCSQPEAPVEKNVAKFLGETDPVAYSNGLVFSFDKRIKVWCNTGVLTEIIKDPDIGFNLPDSFVVISVIVAHPIITTLDSLRIEKEFAAKSHIKRASNSAFPQKANKQADLFGFISIDNIVGEIKSASIRNPLLNAKTDSHLKEIYAGAITGKLFYDVRNHGESKLGLLRFPRINLELLVRRTAAAKPFEVMSLSPELVEPFLPIPTPTPPTPKL